MPKHLKANAHRPKKRSSSITPVCEESAAKPVVDFHDYPDSKEKEPMHFALLTCERCGKEFII